MCIRDRAESLLSDVERRDVAERARKCLHQSAMVRHPFDQLTGREQEILLALMDGKAAAEIASDMFVSLATVRTHIRALLTKLHVTSQLGAVAIARGANWPRATRSASPNSSRTIA